MTARPSSTRWKITSPTTLRLWLTRSRLWIQPSRPLTWWICSLISVRSRVCLSVGVIVLVLHFMDLPSPCSCWELTDVLILLVLNRVNAHDSGYHCCGVVLLHSVAVIHGEHSRKLVGVWRAALSRFDRTMLPFVFSVSFIFSLNICFLVLSLGLTVRLIPLHFLSFYLTRSISRLKRNTIGVA